MDFTRLRALGSLFSMLNQMVRNILLYNHQHADFPMQDCAATNPSLSHYIFDPAVDWTSSIMAFH